jgi:hypothetical protein
MLPNLEKPSVHHENQFWFCLGMAGGAAIGVLVACVIFALAVKP